MSSDSLIRRLLASSPKPAALFEKGSAGLWTDPHLSEQMLAAHLDPSTNAASRKPDTVDRSVSWIHEYLCAANPQLAILDLGCGPGLYTERLARLGHPVTGIDFSRRSIDYARAQADSAGLSVRYLHEDYLSGDIGGPYDVILMIYCDFGVFDEAERGTILTKVHDALKPGGCFLFDVFQPSFYRNASDSTSWHAADRGFWRNRPYLCLESSIWYEETRTNLNSYLVLDETDGLTTYRVWDQTYTAEELTGLLRRGGFSAVELYADVTGLPMSKDSVTLCSVGRKPQDGPAAAGSTSS